MRRAQGCLLQHIVNTDYLLPYGQLIANHRRGLSLNATGVYIWELLGDEPSREELRQKFLERFLTEPGQEEMLTSDLYQFLDQLVASGLAEDDAPPQIHNQVPSAYIKIGGITVSIAAPCELIDNSFLKDFSTAPSERIDQRVIVSFAPPLFRTNGTILVRDTELVVCERERDYLILFPTFSQIREVSLSKDGTDVVFRCIHPVNEDLEFQFFHALRLAFLYLAEKRGMYAIHSASILYRDRAWLFSASAGTGKSTHVNLWRELYQTAVLNGDLNLLAIEDGRPVIHGIPWCGTSEVFDKRTLPLGGIVLLLRGTRDYVEELSDDQKALLILQRFISPIWTAEQLGDSAQFAEQLSGIINVCRMHCTKDTSAAETMRRWIDEKL